MAQTSAESAGVRLAFRTAATTIELDVAARRMAPDAASALPPSRYELTRTARVVAEARAVAGSRYLFTFEDPSGRVVDGPPSTVRFAGLPAVETEYELWLPFTDAIELLALRADAPVAPPADRGAVRWLHHGSSISHGYSAESTDRNVAGRGRARHRCRADEPGVLGQRHARPVHRPDHARPARRPDQPQGRHQPRERRRDARCGHSGRRSTGSSTRSARGIRRRRSSWCRRSSARRSRRRPVRPCRIRRGRTSGRSPAEPRPRSPRASSRWARSARRSPRSSRGAGATDPNLHYVDGRDLYGPADAERMPLPDNLHPGPDVQRLIGERFADQVLRPLLRGQG